MALLKKWFVFIVYYIIASFIALLAGAVGSLIFKLLLITVQGPTVLFVIVQIVTFYISFSIASFFLFRKYGKRNQQVKNKEIILFYSALILLHFIIIFYGDWDSIYTITKGSLPVTIRLYTGTFERTHGILYSSLRDIPRIYYYIGQSIEDICFMIFSLTGFLIGKRFNETKWHTPGCSFRDNGTKCQMNKVMFNRNRGWRYL